MNRLFCCIIVAVILTSMVGCTIQMQNSYDETAEIIVKDTNDINTDTQDICEAKIETLTQNAIDEFLAITKIPRPGFHLEHIREYLIQYTKEHSFEYSRDNYGNLWMDIPVHAGLECSWFFQKHKGIKLASVGPQIYDAHTVKETLFIDTIKPCIEAVIYTLENIKH